MDRNDTALLLKLDSALNGEAPSLLAKDRAMRRTMKKLKKKTGETGALDASKEAVRRLVLQHRTLTVEALAEGNKLRHDSLSHMRDIIQVKKEALEERIDSLEEEIVAAVRAVPIWNVFLKKVHGMGALFGAYFIAYLDPCHKEKNGGVTKPSSFVQYCGLSVKDGKLARLVAGKSRDYNPVMQERLFNLFTVMSKCSAGRKACIKPFKGKMVQYSAVPAKTCKYLEVYAAVKARLVAAGKSNGNAHDAGWHTAMRIFLDDLYVVWRALEGQPVWCTYRAEKMGAEHGGQITEILPKVMTVEQALARVGDVGARPVPTCDGV